MKERIILLCFIFLLNIDIYAGHKAEDFFNNFNANIDKFSTETFNMESPTSEGQLLFVFSYDEKVVYRIDLFSSLGQTSYTSYYDSTTRYWYIKKEALFYLEPFELSDAETEISYFKFNGNVFKYDENENSYIEGLDIDTSPAIIDYRTADEVIQINLEYINTRK